ncbi:speckle-type POZ protein-like [Daphnia pulicaria]|uniref:speckle-type POZ protein-like n=1 Tax=Daphnia pulicaria TaxID=35523 RepID=UPI001EEA3F96|nr:speckle-type POZ protein-like [Daphnia pulicaria]
MAQQVIANAASSTQAKLPAISLASSSFWCQTKGEVEELDFEWTIERLAFLVDGGIWETLKSADFLNFSLSLNSDTHSHVEVKLNIQASCFPNPIKVELTISIEKGKTLFQNWQKTTSIPQNTFSPVTVLTVNKKALLESGDFVKENITIYCKIGVLKRNVLKGKASATERYIQKTPIIEDSQQNYQGLIQILHQHKELFEKMPLSDVTFNIRGRKFPAHKAILIMRSPVFAAMFLHPTKELQTGEVEVEDIDPDVFQEVLRYLYTGLTRSTIMDVMAPGLLAAAEKYLLEDLKTRCETHLIRKMSAKNCLGLLTLTTHHPAEHLKKFALQYFRRIRVRSWTQTTGRS